MATDPQLTRTDLEFGVRRSLRLLIVDDDVVQRELLKRAAGRSKFEITLAGSCGEAIRHLETDSLIA